MKRIIAAVGVVTVSVVVWVALASLPADAQLGPGRTTAVTISGPASVTGTVAITGPVSATGTVAITPPMPASTPAQESPIAVSQSNLSAFGDLISVGMTPTFQADFVYGINVQTGITSVTSTGVVDTVASRGLRIQTGVGVGGVGHYESRRPASYRPGQGVIARWTAIFAPCVASSLQFAGVGNNDTDGLGLGCNGAAFGIRHLNAGVSAWTAQSSWNGDKANGTGASGFTLDPTKGNVYQITYPYLGFGNITFWVQDSATSRWLLLHTIRYTNANVTTQLANPSQDFHVHAENSGNSTNLTMYVGSVGMFITGMRAYVGPKWAANNNKTAITTEANVISLRNATTYNGVPNHQLIRLRTMSIGYANAGASIATVRLTLGATLGGSPSFTTVSGTTANGGVTITSGQSSASFDVAGTTVTGGIILQNSVATNATSYLIDLTPFDIFVGPGETLTASGAATSSGQVGIGLTWDEAN